jgi:hypothetical protein
MSNFPDRFTNQTGDFVVYFREIGLRWKHSSFIRHSGFVIFRVSQSNIGRKQNASLNLSIHHYPIDRPIECHDFLKDIC